MPQSRFYGSLLPITLLHLSFRSRPALCAEIMEAGHLLRPIRKSRCRNACVHMVGSLTHYRMELSLQPPSGLCDIPEHGGHPSPT
jgi:hypothetical protein